MKAIKPENYIRLFHVEGFDSYFFGQIFQHWYGKIDDLIIAERGSWTNYIPRKVAEKTKKEGLKLLGGNRAFGRYIKGFNSYRRRARAIPMILRKKILSKGDLDKLISLFSEFFKHYGKTEFFYTDLAFAKLTEGNLSSNSDLGQNLKRLGKIKWRGRILLNRLFLEDKSYLAQTFGRLANQFGYAKADIANASQEEAKVLFRGRKLDAKRIARREASFCLAALNSKPVQLSPKEEAGLVREFKKSFSKVSSTLRGTPANPGVVHGIAKVIMPNVESFSHYLKEAEQMKEGAILIAETTSPEIIVACRKAKAIVTNQGGLMSHAAIISRELGIPCVVGTQNATNVIKSGDLVEVDANKGVINVLKKY